LKLEKSKSTISKGLECIMLWNYVDTILLNLVHECYFSNQNFINKLRLSIKVRNFTHLLWRVTKTPPYHLLES